MKKIFQNKNKMGRKVLSKAKGYTIIETMIAVSLFLVIVMIGMGSLVNANSLHQKSQSMRSILDNLNFVMEDMSRNLRTGYSYYCIVGNDAVPNVSTAKSGQDCWGIAFKPADGGSQWAYEIVTADGGANYYIRKSIDDGATWVQLTPNEINIDPVSSFSIIGAEPGDGLQPFVTIYLVGKIKVKDGVETSFSLRTSVSQRLLDNITPTP